MHALIIEDDDIVAMTIESVLRECGFTSYDLAPSAGTAIEAAACRTPDLITADVRLEQGCGVIAVESICEGPPVPVVFVTGNAAEVTKRRAEHRVVTKPFTDTELIAAVASAMLEIAGADVRHLARNDGRLSFPPIGTGLSGEGHSLH